MANWVGGGTKTGSSPLAEREGETEGDPGDPGGELGEGLRATEFLDFEFIKCLVEEERNTVYLFRSCELSIV